MKLKQVEWLHVRIYDAHSAATGGRRDVLCGFKVPQGRLYEQTVPLETFTMYWQAWADTTDFCSACATAARLMDEG